MRTRVRYIDLMSNQQNNISNAARTYAEAVANAEQISIHEIAQMLEQNDNPDIFPGPRRPRHIAMGAQARIWKFDDGSEYGYVAYDRCDRKGYLQSETASIGNSVDRPIFYFPNSGRTVQVAAPV